MKKSYYAHHIVSCVKNCGLSGVLCISHFENPINNAGTFIMHGEAWVVGLEYPTLIW